MSKIFAIGTGPLLDEGVKKVSGQCLRTWHFVRPLLEDGHQVSLVTLSIPDRFRPPEIIRESSEKKKFDGFAYTEILKEEPRFLHRFLVSEIEAFKPNCIVGINTHPSAVCARVAGHIPVWADLNGWAMAEGQTRARLDGDDAILAHFWRDECDACRRADRFSTVTKNQKLALMGELAALGRLNQYTFDYAFADVIENAVNPMFAAPPPDVEPQVRGKKVPQDAFIVLWSGGFNTWTDVKLLYDALARAMNQNDRIYFVSTGGNVDGHDEKTYGRFHQLLVASPFRKRFILFGWIEAERLPPLYSECDVGINVDAINYETLFGARNRLTNMLAAGLPVVTTLGTDISRTIEKNRLGKTVPLSDPEALAVAILELASTPIQTRTIAQRARSYALEHFSYAATTAPLREWVSEPELAPDSSVKIKRYPDAGNLLTIWLSDVEKSHALIMDKDIEDLIRAKDELAVIRSRPLFRLYKRIQRVFKGL